MVGVESVEGKVGIEVTWIGSKRKVTTVADSGSCDIYLFGDANQPLSFSLFTFLQRVISSDMFSVSDPLTRNTQGL